MSEKELFKDWFIVTSKSGYNRNGFPTGEFLCRSDREVEELKGIIGEENILIKKYGGNNV